MNKFECGGQPGLKVTNAHGLYWLETPEGLIPSYLMFKARNGKAYAILRAANRRWYDYMLLPTVSILRP